MTDLVNEYLKANNAAQGNNSDSNESSSSSSTNSNGWLNHCPQCNEDEKLKYKEGQGIVCEACNAIYCPQCGKLQQAGNGMANVKTSDSENDESFTPGEQLSPCPSQSTEVQQTAQIKDKTFENCIRRICIATDSVFLVENNAAFLFPYTDWMEHTLKQKIQTISAKEQDPTVYQYDYFNEGFYNKVSYHVGEYNQEAKKEDRTEEDKPTGYVQYDSLVAKYGELEKEIKTPFEDEETAKYVANSLLLAYVREFNGSCKTRTLGQKYFIGGTFYVVEGPHTKEKELFYLQGYFMRTEKNTPLYVDLDFKYGPEGAEELADYQILTGGASSGVAQSGDLLSIMCEVGKRGNDGTYTTACSERDCFDGVGGDCIAWSYQLFDALDKHGWTVRVVYAPMGHGQHWQCQYKDKNGGDWKDLPYGEAREKCNYDQLIAGTSTAGIQVKEEFSNEGAVGKSAGKTL